MRLHFDIDPVAKGRPRMTRAGHAYTPAKTRRFESTIQSLARRDWKEAPMDGPLSIEVIFAMKPPKRPKSRMPVVKPDLDNLCKAVTDALNGICYHDDSQICRAELIKIYDWANGKGSISVQLSAIRRAHA